MRNMDVAIPIVFPDYLIEVGIPEVVVTVPDLLPWVDVLPNRVRLPPVRGKVENLGHAGIMFIEGQTGLTRYYEYGRYDAAQRGLTRRQVIPDVQIGANGRPVKKSLELALTQVSLKAGQRGSIQGVYVELTSPAFIRMDSFAKERMKANANKKREPYHLLNRSCLHFMKDVAEYGGAQLPPVVAPHPAGYIIQARFQQPDVDFDATTRTLTVEGIQLE